MDKSSIQWRVHQYYLQWDNCCLMTAVSEEVKYSINRQSLQVGESFQQLSYPESTFSFGTHAFFHIADDLSKKCLFRLTLASRLCLCK